MTARCRVRRPFPEVAGDFLAAFRAGSLTADVNESGTLSTTDFSVMSTWIHQTAEPVRIGYAGYVRDGVTGRLLARNRWYEPSAGRWQTRDPAGYVDGLSLYLYVRGNPMSLVDPTGLRGGPDSPEWNHMLPQQVFMEKNAEGKDVPRFEGIDPNDKEFGQVMRRDDHRGGKQVSSPRSPADIHTDYNKHWEEWINSETRSGRPITRESVIKHLDEIRSGNGEFANWLRKGIQADRSYIAWNAKDFSKEKWFAGKLEAEKEILVQCAKKAIAAGGDATKAAQALEMTGKALKALGFVGVAFAIFDNAEAVYAGTKSPTEGIIDSVSPIEVQDGRNMQTIIKETIDNFIGNTRARMKHIDSMGAHSGYKPIPSEQMPIGAEH